MPTCRAMPALDCLQSWKKTNVYPLTTTSLPNYNENIVWSCRLKAHTLNTYLNARACHTICSINPNRITHANQFSDPCVRQDARRPNQSQRFDVADPVPHWARGGASLRSATVFRNRIPSGWKSPKLRGERNRIPRNSLIPPQKNWPECPSFWHRLGTLKYQDSTWSERQSHSYDYKHMYKHERKMLHQTHVQIPAKIWTLIFKNHESMTPHSRKKTVCKKCCQTCNHQANINDKIQTNNSVVSRVWAPALAYATLFRKQQGTCISWIQQAAPSNSHKKQSCQWYVLCQQRPAAKVCRA